MCEGEMYFYFCVNQVVCKYYNRFLSSFTKRISYTRHSNLFQHFRSSEARYRQLESTYNHMVWKDHLYLKLKRFRRRKLSAKFLSWINVPIYPSKYISTETVGPVDPLTIHTQPIRGQNTTIQISVIRSSKLVLKFRAS